MNLATTLIERDAELARQLLAQGYPYPGDTAQTLNSVMEAGAGAAVVMGSPFDYSAAQLVASRTVGNVAWTQMAAGRATLAGTYIYGGASYGVVYGGGVVRPSTIAEPGPFGTPLSPHGALSRSAVPTLLSEIADRLLSETGRLQDGWDGSGGRAPDQQTIETLTTLLSLVPPETSIPEAEVDGSDGSVSLRWYAGSRVLSLSTSGRRVTGVLSSRTASAQWGFDVGQAESLESAIAAALDQLANA